MPASAAMPAIAHVALTVSNVSASATWYTALLGTEPVLDEHTGAFRHVVFQLGATLLGLHEFDEPISTDRFTEHRAGLDHVAFGCVDRDELVSWATRLDVLGISHGDIVDAGYGSGLSFRDPDNIALELFAPPSP